jgi:membrane protein DedA with SNARE-associated domain
MTVEGLVTEYGLWAVFLGAIAEGETVTFLGGAFAHRGLLPFAPVVLAAAAGSFLFDQAVFMVARHLREHPLAAGLRTRAAPAVVMLDRWPRLFAFGFQFIPGMRIAGALALGASAIPYALFAALNLAAALVWAAIYAALGYHGGLVIEAVAGRVHWLWILAMGGAVAALFVWLRMRRGPIRG